MTQFFDNRLFTLGFWLLLVGSGPLFAVAGLAAIGLWPDPNPTPIGLGLMAALTFWPALAFLFIGIVQTLQRPK